jgi:uncharacterized protein YbjT (DUF2867 family)
VPVQPTARPGPRASAECRTATLTRRSPPPAPDKHEPVKTRNIRLTGIRRSGAAGQPAGIELAAGDLDDPASVAKAVTGAEAIFLMHVGTGTGQTTTMVAAARDAAVPRIVLLSSAGARLLPLDGNPMGAAFAAREQILRQSGLGVTYLRPSAFASNALGWRDAIRARSKAPPAARYRRSLPPCPNGT